MSVHIDPITRQRIIVQPNSGDVVYELRGDSAVAEEDVSLIGPWNDYTGSDLDVSSRQQQQFASSENELFGTVPHIVDGAKLPNLSVVGTNEGTHRRRTKLRYVSFDKEGKPRFE